MCVDGIVLQLFIMKGIYLIAMQWTVTSMKTNGILIVNVI